MLENVQKIVKIIDIPGNYFSGHTDLLCLLSVYYN
jgi:hypothetical protein